MKKSMFGIKHRPRKFAEVAGHDLIKKGLASTKMRDRVPSAILFAGPSGVGKTTLARIYAKYINCSDLQKSGNMYEPCGKCRTCVAIDKDSAIDFREINAATSRGLDDMRQMIDTSQVSLSDLKYRVFIVDEAQQLPKASQMALLRPLEEERGRNIYLFCTTDPDRILPTITNRCSRYDLGKLKKSVVVGKLKEICAAEGVEYEDAAINDVVYASDGSLREALNMIDQASKSNDNRLDISAVSMFTGLTLNVTTALVDNILCGNAYNVFLITTKLDEKDVPVEKVFGRVVSYLNDILIYMHMGKNPAQACKLLQFDNQEYISSIQNHSEIISNPEIIHKLVKCFVNRYKNIESYPVKKHLLSLALSECLSSMSTATHTNGGE